jgi:DNA-binding Lrp family transcriptional regulator
VIIGYTALLDPVAMGRAFELLVNVDLTHTDRDTVECFEAELATLDEVIRSADLRAARLVVRIGTPDVDPTRPSSAPGSAVPGIATIDSHLTMKVVKSPDRRAAQPSK